MEYLVSLVDGLTNGYIRRSRRRFWASGMSRDKLSAYGTLYYVLVCTTKMFAPVAHILSEKMYKVLTGSFPYIWHSGRSFPGNMRTNNCWRM